MDKQSTPLERSSGSPSQSRSSLTLVDREPWKGSRRLSPAPDYRRIVPWTSARLKDLASLSLNALAGYHPPSLEELTRLLALSPNLVDLKLNDVEVGRIYDDDNTVNTLNLERLPTFRLLKRLQLAKVPRFAYDYLLDQIPLYACSGIESRRNPVPHTSACAVSCRHDSPNLTNRVKHSLGREKPIQLTLHTPDVLSEGRVGIELSTYPEESALGSIPN
ncbi:hypothetical protein FRB96_007702 [Tulasnella sp. 330]|nr:hypothetical protein FRB96_007702 [Tulasnella sp. 330]